MKLPRFPIPFKVFRRAVKELSANDPLRMAGAMSFFTTFALPAVIIIIIQALGLVFNEQRISNQLFEKLERWGYFEPEEHLFRMPPPPKPKFRQEGRRSKSTLPPAPLTSAERSPPRAVPSPQT